MKALNILDGKSYSFEVEDGRIKYLTEIAPSPEMLFICPEGLIDSQVNGILGMDYSDPGLCIDSVKQICIELAKTGTLRHLPTIVTRPESVILRNIRKIAEAERTDSFVRNSIVGIHIEGPFISHEDGPRGAHDISSVRKCNIEEFDSWLAASDGLLKYITIAPESDGAIELIKHAVNCGVVCSIGHSGATKSQIDSAAEAGATLSTHLGNGVYSELKRYDNPVFSILANSALSAGVIADGDHVGPALLKVISLCKSIDQIILVSDLAPMAGMAKGTRMKWGGVEVEIAPDGSVRLADTPYLAGAGSSLFNDVMNFNRITEIPLADCFKMATLNPVKMFNLDAKRFCLKENMPARFLLFDSNGIVKVLF